MSVKANDGERMIELRVKFFTNNITSEQGTVDPKTAWASGWIVATANKTHGITNSKVKPKAFHSFAGIQTTMEDVLAEHGIKLMATRRERKYR